MISEIFSIVIPKSKAENVETIITSFFKQKGMNVQITRSEEPEGESLRVVNWHKEGIINEKELTHFLRNLIIDNKEIKRLMVRGNLNRGENTIFVSVYPKKSSQMEICSENPSAYKIYDAELLHDKFFVVKVDHLEVEPKYYDQEGVVKERYAVKCKVVGEERTIQPLVEVIKFKSKGKDAVYITSGPKYLFMFAFSSCKYWNTQEDIFNEIKKKLRERAYEVESIQKIDKK